MAAINVRDMKRLLEHLAEEALIVVVSDWEEREVPLDPKWLLFDERSKRFIIKGPLVFIDEDLEQDLGAIGEIRAKLRGWERLSSAEHRELLREMSELLARGH